VNKISPHIPISIKIKKEKEEAFKDLDNKDWAHDFELEVTNTGTKPIYALDLETAWDVPNLGGQELYAMLVYGRVEMGDLRSVPTPEDIPIKPGESAVLTVHPSTVTAWDINGRKEGRRLPKWVEVRFQFLSFGDHTGYVGYSGGAMPWNPEHPKINFNFTSPKSDKSPPAALEWPSFKASLPRFQSAAIPATFLPVNFFKSESSHILTVEAEPSNWCCASPCIPAIFHRRVTCYGCQEHDDPSFTYCNDDTEFAACYYITAHSEDCVTGGTTYTWIPDDGYVSCWLSDRVRFGGLPRDL